MEHKSLKKILKNQKKILKEVQKIDIKCNKVLMGTVLEETNNYKQKLVENIKIIEDLIDALSPSPNENYVAQQSPGNYDLMKDIEIYLENHQTNPHDSPGN